MAQEPDPFDFHIDIRETADRENMAIEDVIRKLEEARDTGSPTSFRQPEGGVRMVTVRYVEFHDGKTSLNPTDNRVKYCRVIAEDAFLEIGG